MSDQRKLSVECVPVRKRASKLTIDGSDLDIFRHGDRNKSKQTLPLKKPSYMDGLVLPRTTKQRNSIVSMKNPNNTSAIRGTIVSSSNSSRRKESLMQELMNNDRLDDESSFSSDSQISMKKTKKLDLKSSRGLEHNNSNYNGSDFEFISHTIHSRMSQISKNNLNSVKMRQPQDQQQYMKGTQKSLKKMKSSSKIPVNQSIHKFRKENSIISNVDVQSMASQRSVRKTLEYDQIVKLLENAQIAEEDKQKYQALLEELEKKCETTEPQKRDMVRRKVRQTFVNLFQKFHVKQSIKMGADSSNEKDQQFQQFSNHEFSSSNSMGLNESIFTHKLHEGPITVINPSSMVVRHPSLQENITSIMENQFNYKFNDNLKKFMQDFICELNENDDDQDDYDEQDSSEIEDYSEDQSAGSLKDPTVMVLKHEMRRYQQKSVRDPLTDSYALEWVSNQDFNWAIKEFIYYRDKGPLLKLRIVVVTIARILHIFAEKIINHNIFVIAVLASIFFNIVVFIEEQQSQGNEAKLATLRQRKQLVLVFFITENILKFVGYGLVKFLQNLWNVLDTIILILLIIHVQNQDLIIIDFSTVRILRVLLFMGLFIRPLKIMLQALSESVKFLIEALVIVLIFTFFFSLFGLHLFVGLFRLKCHHEDTGIVIPRMCGYDQECNSGQYCAYSFTNPQIPSHFDDFLYAYGQIIRVMIYNDWTEPVYFSMRTFHSASIILYILVIFIAGMFGSNLIIAVLKIYYSQTLQNYQKELSTPVEQQYELNKLNLMQIKAYQIDRGFKTVQISMKTIVSNGSTMMDMTLEKKKRATLPRKTRGNQKKKYLSARQSKEMEEQLKTEMGIRPPKGKWVSFFEKLSFDNFLMTKYLDRQYWNVLNGSHELQQDENKMWLISNFQSNPFLSWSTQVKPNFIYKSNSEADIQNVKKKRQVVRDREMNLIRAMTPKQYYIIQQKDIDQFKRYTRREQTFVSTRSKFMKNKHRFPIKKREAVRCVSPRRINVFSPGTVNMQQQYVYENPATSRQLIQDDMESKGTAQNGLFILNGLEFDYEGIRVLINRHNLEQEQEENINQMEDRYVKFRKEECLQSMILKHNWSGDDITNTTFGRKANIFRDLNRQDALIWLTGVEGSYRIVRKHIIWMLRKKSVETMFDCIVFFNVLLLCLEGIVESSTLSTMNDVFTFFLVVEILFKLISVGIKRFCQKLINLFDTGIVLASLGEILIRLIIWNVQQDMHIYLSLMRACQGILFYRVIKYNKFAVQMAVITDKTFASFFNLIVLMLFVLLVFAFIGMNLFKDKFPLTTENGLLHSFTDLPKSFITVFDRSTGDDWYGLVIHGTTYSYPVPTMLYCIIFVYLLNYMTFGLVLAIILDGFSSYHVDDDEIDQIKVKKINTEVSDEVKELANNNPSINSGQTVTESSIGDINFEATYFAQTPGQTIQQQTLLPIVKSNNKFIDLQANIDRMVDLVFRDFEFFTNEESELSLYIFDQNNKFRKLCYRIVKYNIYHQIMNLVIMISLLNMGVYTYYDWGDDIHNISQYIRTVELLMNLIVFVDCFMKIVAFGLCLDKGAFTNELWRAVDFIYVIAFIVNIWVEFQLFYYISFIKYLRPMRFVNMFKSLKELNEALARSMMDFLNIMIVELMVWFIFAIFGVIIYKNKLQYCEYPLNFYVNQEECINQGLNWVNYVHNFDNIFNAIATLYVISTGDGWGLTFQICYNSNSADIGPSPLVNQWITYIYYFLFQVVGSLFFMGFVTGILFVNFQTNRTIVSKQLYTDDQQLFIQVTEIIMKEQTQYSDPPNSFLRLLASDIISNRAYKKIIPPAIFTNAIVLSLHYFEADSVYNNTLNNIYYALSFVMISDTILKLMAYGIVRYWGYVWRKMELILSLISLIDFIVDLTIGWTNYYFHSSIRDQYFIPVRLFFALRNLRILLIIQEFKGLARLLRVLQFSGPFLMQILMIYFAVLFVFAYIGCELFGQINKGVIIDDYLNFTNFPLAMITLFKCSTKNGWRFIMTDCTPLNPYCATDPKYCGQDWLLVNCYFYAYVFLSYYIVLNLFVTALVDQFEKFFKSQNSVLQTYIENIDGFRTVWCKYTSETKGVKMHTKYLAHFLLELGPPLGALKGDNIWDSAKSACNFKIKADMQGYVHFQEVLYETVRYAYKQQIFHVGSEESIEAIKTADRDTRFRLHYRQMNINERRQPVQAQIYLKGNFNVLQEHFYLLMVFRTWEAYSNKLLQGARVKVQADDKNLTEFSNNSDLQDDPPNELAKCKLQYPTLNTIENDDEDEDDVHKCPRYSFKKNPKRARPKLKFMDNNSETPQDIDFVFEPDDPVNPQSPNDQIIARTHIRLKSALKPQLRFPDSVDTQFQALSMGSVLQVTPKRIPNPMSDEPESHNASVVNESAVDQEEQIMLVNNFNFARAPVLLSDSLQSDEIVGTESHKDLRVRKFQPKLKHGRQY